MIKKLSQRDYESITVVAAQLNAIVWWNESEQQATTNINSLMRDAAAWLVKLRDAIQKNGADNDLEV